MMSQDSLSTVHAAGGGYGPPPGGGYGAPPGGYGQPGGYGAPPGAPMGPPGGAPMAPPGGMGAPMPGGGMGGGADPGLAKSLQTWFILSILSIFCGCCALGAIPIYMTYAGKQSLERGDVNDARSKLKIAKICVILGWVGVVLYTIFYVVYFVFLGGMAALGNM